MSNTEYTHLPEYIAIKVSNKFWNICQLSPQRGKWKTPDYVVIHKALLEARCFELMQRLQQPPNVSAGAAPGRGEGGKAR